VYCTIDDLKKVLPSTVTIGSQNIGTPSPGNAVTKKDNLTIDQAIFFIRQASSDMDARLRGQFICPLRRVKTFETDVLEDVNIGSSVKIRVWDNNNFAKGDIVRIQSKDTMELSTITDTTDFRYIIVDKVQYKYLLDESKISILKFPDPISIVCSRLAVSYAFDQLFNAEQAPNISQYGVEQRKLALNSIDSILSGTVLLTGQDYVGRRFIRGQLLDSYNSPTADFQFGREKGA
jgi:hypothetical protein